MLALPDAAALGASVLAALALARAAGWGWRALVSRLAHVEGIVAALLLALPFTTQGTPAFALGPLAASVEGLALAGTLALRITACALVAMALLAALDPARLGQALARLGLPERLARLVMLVARYSGLFREEIGRLRAAMALRGFRGGLSRHALRSWGWLVGMTLVRALERAERAEEAMRLRLWAGALPRDRSGRFGPADARFGAGVALGLGLALVWP